MISCFDLQLIETVDFWHILALKATLSSETPVVFDMVKYNEAGMYNPVNGIYTTPTTAYYLIDVHLYSDGGKADYKLLLNGIYLHRSRTEASGGDQVANGLLLLKLDAGDTMQVVTVGNNQLWGGPQIVTYFQIMLLYQA